MLCSSYKFLINILSTYLMYTFKILLTYDCILSINIITDISKKILKSYCQGVLKTFCCIHVFMFYKLVCFLRPIKFRGSKFCGSGLSDVVVFCGNCGFCEICN